MVEIIKFEPIKINALQAAGVVIAVPVVIAGVYYGYKAYRALKGLLAPLAQGAGAAQGAASTVWNARPKIIFKGIEVDSLTGLEQFV
ncbi:Uncharacterised protein [uncultured archaeon]|nr:Uncharacterised protein [uncultured archaeon]